MATSSRSFAFLRLFLLVGLFAMNIGLKGLISWSLDGRSSSLNEHQTPLVSLEEAASTRRGLLGHDEGQHVSASSPSSSRFTNRFPHSLSLAEDRNDMKVLASNSTNVCAPSNSSSVPDCSQVRHYAQYCNNETGLPFASECEFSNRQCVNSSAVLVNYIGFIYCTLSDAKPAAYVVLIFWLLLLVSLLATTADYFFVPPLEILSEKLRLSPPVAGITLLALGNGAPDVFTAYASLNGANDYPLELGALLGASIFIGTVVLGSVLLMSTVGNSIRPSDFYRDLLVYMVVVATVVTISFDGKITIYEAASLLVIYLVYIAIVVILTRRRYGDFKFVQLKDDDFNLPSINNDENEKIEDPVFAGVTWPEEGNIFTIVQYIVEFPFSVARWLTIPCPSDAWGPKRRLLAILSPPFIVALLVLAGKAWKGFAISFGSFPMSALIISIGAPISVLIYATSSPSPENKPVYFPIFTFLAFVTSIAWLNIQANETVAILEAFGIAFGIDTAILGLTVLAIGNSVGDFVADTAVARAGKPSMGVASCFGSPLLNDVLGLGISLSSYCVRNYPRPFHFDINDSKFVEVKLSWIFLGMILFSHLVFFPLFKFNPPRFYGFGLIAFYVFFMACSILANFKYIKF